MVRAVLLALLVALALPMGVAAVPADAEPPATSLESLDDVAILTLGDGSRASFATPSVDVATAMAVQHEAAEARLDRYTLEARLDRTTSTEARQTLLFEAATEIENRIETLGDDEQALRTAYAERSIDTETFVRQLALIHARAGTLRADLDRIQAHADEIPQFSLRSQVSRLDAALFGYEGPVRDRTLAALQGDAPSTRVHVAVSDRGAVLSTIQSDRFVREAYRTDNQDSATDSIGIDEANDRATELYPYAYNLSNSLSTGLNSLSGGLFRIDIELREGFITAYMDGSTRDVFFEVQERRLDLLGHRPSVVGTTNSTQLAVNRSYPGGPLEITVTDATSGEPVSTAVFVADHRVETGSDGTVWTLAPASASFQVRAVGPDGNVTVTVQPLAPRTVDAEG